ITSSYQVAMLFDFKNRKIGRLFIIKSHLNLVINLIQMRFLFTKKLEVRKMKKMDYQNVKGTQDYLPNAEKVRRDIRRILEDVFIQYGCQPIETPILNYTELLASKYGGGAEILEEMYTLTDRGERSLALRYDLTIPFAKVIAMNPTLKFPFKRYEIGKVFRDGPIKTGRLREFTQCDVDIVGVESQIAEAEEITLHNRLYVLLFSGRKYYMDRNNKCI